MLRNIAVLLPPMSQCRQRTKITRPVFREMSEAFYDVFLKNKHGFMNNPFELKTGKQYSEKVNDKYFVRNNFSSLKMDSFWYMEINLLFHLCIFNPSFVLSFPNKFLIDSHVKCKNICDKKVKMNNKIVFPCTIWINNSLLKYKILEVS